MNRRTTSRIGAALLPVAVLLFSGCGRSAASSVEHFYRAVGRGDITEAKTYLSAQLTQTLGDAKLTSVLSAATQKVQACGGIKASRQNNVTKF